jgi:outer membrane protein, heavy metal efflux system
VLVGDARAQQVAAPEPAPGFTLAEAYELAAQRNPRLVATRSLAEAVGTREGSAGLPPDPMLQLGVMNLSLPGFSADMPTSMAPSIQAMQMLPFFGKLSLGRRIAEQTTGIHEARAGEAWWEVRASVAGAFYEVYAADRQLEVMRATLLLLEDFERIARTMYASGMGRQADVLRASVEIAKMEADIARMEAMREVSASMLNALLDRPADTAVPAPVRPDLAVDVPDLHTLRDWAEQTRPLIEGGLVAVERSRTETRLARRELWPDLTVGIQYGQRNAVEMGTERMASAMIGFSVPIFAGRRQLRMRDEAAAMERMAAADLAEIRAEVDGRLGKLRAELQRTRTLIRLYRQEVLPQAEAAVESSLSAYQAGTVDFLSLIDAQMIQNHYEQEFYGLLADYGTVLAELEATVGREILATDDILAEVFP